MFIICSIELCESRSCFKQFKQYHLRKNILHKCTHLYMHVKLLLTTDINFPYHYSCYILFSRKITYEVCIDSIFTSE